MLPTGAPAVRIFFTVRTTDKRKREHKLFATMPAHVRKLRESAAVRQREQDRRAYKARQTLGTS
jgi:hypothetical protein